MVSEFGYSSKGMKTARARIVCAGFLNVVLGFTLILASVLGLTRLHPDASAAMWAGWGLFFLFVFTIWVVGSIGFSVAVCEVFRRTRVRVDGDELKLSTPYPRWNTTVKLSDVTRAELGCPPCRRSSRLALEDGRGRKIVIDELENMDVFLRLIEDRVSVALIDRNQTIHLHSAKSLTVKLIVASGLVCFVAFYFVFMSRLGS